MARTVLPMLEVSDGVEVARLILNADGTVSTSGGSAAGVLATYVREYELSEAEAFRKLDREGWSNAYLVIRPDGE